jgi:hypothetical protein
MSRLIALRALSIAALPCGESQELGSRAARGRREKGGTCAVAISLDHGSLMPKYVARAAYLFGIAVEPGELRALTLAFLCHFVLLASYYILLPLRDTTATLVGVGQLQYLFTITFAVTVLCAPLYSALAEILSRASPSC